MTSGFCTSGCEGEATRTNSSSPDHLCAHVSGRDLLAFAHDGEVVGVVLDLRDDRVRRVNRNLQLDVGKFVPKGHHDFWEHVDADDLGGAYADHAAAKRAQIRQFALEVVDPVEDVARAAHENLARVGQHHLAAGAVEERHAELLLKRRDVAAHGRLREVELVRGPCKAAALGHREKGLHLLEIEHASSSKSLRILMPFYQHDLSRPFKTLHGTASPRRPPSDFVILPPAGEAGRPGESFVGDARRPQNRREPAPRAAHESPEAHSASSSTAPARKKTSARPLSNPYPAST